MAKETFKTRKVGNLTVKTGSEGSKLMVLAVPMSKLTEEDKEWFEYYKEQGYEPVPKRVVENSRTRKQEWFKKNLTEDEYKQFVEIKKTGYTSKTKKDKDTGEFKVYKKGFSAAVNWAYELHPELEPPKKKKSVD